MKQRIARTIQRWPGLYNLVSKTYYGLQPVHIAEMVWGTKARERQWAGKTIAEGYWQDREHPAKQLLAEKIASYSPLNSILEVGCASGPNLYLLAKKFPTARIVGVDINQEAIEYGRARFAQEGITNVELLAGKADKLEQFQDKSFDVVFTNAMLIYVGPDKIMEVLKQLLRVTGRALILVELQRPHTIRSDKLGLGTYQHDNWVRDYTKLLSQFTAGDRIRVTRIPEAVWPARPWRDLGAIIEVVVS